MEADEDTGGNVGKSYEKEVQARVKSWRPFCQSGALLWRAPGFDVKKEET